LVFSKDFVLLAFRVWWFGQPEPSSLGYGALGLAFIGHASSLFTTKGSLWVQAVVMIVAPECVDAHTVRFQTLNSSPYIHRCAHSRP
jgi:hypothetical protein